MLKVQGKFVKRCPEQKVEGRNGQVSKRDFIIETDDEYPKMMCFTLWNKNIGLIENVRTGDKLIVSFTAQSTEGNDDKWWTNMVCHKIGVIRYEDISVGDQAKASDDIESLSDIKKPGEKQEDIF